MADEEFESIRVIRDEVLKGRNDGAVLELQRKKLEIRNQLVAARAEMRKIDAELLGNGANGLDLVMVCW